jgi:glycerol-3-phosphate dehydrogenase
MFWMENITKFCWLGTIKNVFGLAIFALDAKRLFANAIAHLETLALD